MALTGDMEKEILQLVVHKSHRDLLRYLWFEHLFNSKIPEIQAYLFAPLTFGATSEA